jgi:hypothetical protein
MAPQPPLNDAVLFSASQQTQQQAQQAGKSNNIKIPYILFYRQGNNPNPQFFMFYHHSHEIRKVVERIKKHCELMNLRFVNVRPFIVDLDEAEAKQFGAAAAGVGE